MGGDLIDVSLKGNGGENLETVSIGNSFEDLCIKEKQKMGVGVCRPNGLVGGNYFNNGRYYNVLQLIKMTQ